VRFDLNDEQRAIKDAIREVCDARASRGEGAETDGAFWSELAKSGWTQMAVPQEFGGQGSGLLELSLVLEEMGRALVGGAYLGHAAAAVLIAASGDEQQRPRWLPGLATADGRAALGQAHNGGALLVDASGAALAVIAGPETAAVLDPVPGALNEAASLDVTRTLHRVESAGAERLRGDVDRGLDRAEVLLAAELVGVAQRAMELAVEHASNRQQFGRPIGAYQAVSHRCADMLVQVESARSAVLSAAWTADHEPEQLPFAASVAKVTAASAAWQVAAASLQVHGGMGFTWEYPIHRYLRRAAAGARLLRSVDHHLDRIADQNGLGAEAVAAGAVQPAYAVP